MRLAARGMRRVWTVISGVRAVHLVVSLPVWDSFGPLYLYKAVCGVW